MAYKLLLADDSITIQKVVELVLAEEDFEIKSVSNGEDALNLMDTFRPDVVLADIEMPKINGYQLCEKIKQNPMSADIPVILLAGAFEPLDEQLAKKVGADDSVIKPFESQELISKINAAVAMVSAEGQEVIEAERAEEEVPELVEEAGSGVEVETVKAEVADEEVLELVEETESAVEAEFAGLGEDLWAMEEITETRKEDAGIEGVATQKPESVSAEEIAEPKARKEVVLPEVEIPSKEELLKIFEKTVDEKVSSFLEALDIKEALLSSLMPSMKDSIEKVLWEVAPELVEKMLKEILKGSITSLKAEVEKIIWETVPDLARTMISQEIEKIKSEF